MILTVNAQHSREVARAIEEALERLQGAVEVRLAPHGWRSLDIGFKPFAVAFTRDVGDGFWACAELARDSFSWPPQWPVSLKPIFGAGCQRATALMPVVTLPPRAALLHEPGGTYPFSVAGPEAVTDSALQVVDAIAGHQAAVCVTEWADPLAGVAAASAFRRGRHLKRHWLQWVSASGFVRRRRRRGCGGRWVRCGSCGRWGWSSCESRTWGWCVGSSGLGV